VLFDLFLGRSRHAFLDIPMPCDDRTSNVYAVAIPTGAS
jgi:hypothetical protein